jgi:nucleoside-diphosphate kinase
MVVTFSMNCLGLGLKLQTVEQSFAEKHYEDLAKKPFFAGLVQYIISGPVVGMIWEGKGVVATGRKIIGATNPAASEPGTIRGDFAIDVGRLVIFGIRICLSMIRDSVYLLRQRSVLAKEYGIKSFMLKSTRHFNFEITMAVAY